VFLFSLIHYFGVSFSVQSVYGLINLYVLYRKRNIDLLVSHFALKRNILTSVGPAIAITW